MATSKKNGKSTKTAHVLNLLTAPNAEGETAPAEGTEPGTAEEAAEAPAGSRPLTPPILEVARSDDEQLSNQILQALEEEFPAEPEGVPEPESVPAPESAAEPESVPAPENTTESESVPEPEEVPPAGLEVLEEEEASIQERLSAAAEAAEAADAAARGYDLPVTMQENPVMLTHGQNMDPNDENLNYVNVMQILVEEKAPKYIKMFGLCTCRRCEMDVKALTLSNLVPKYVVMHKDEMIPMLTIYEGRYSSTIFAQLTRACKIVMDRPHHKRD